MIVSMKIEGGQTPGFPPARLQANFASRPLVSQTLGSFRPKKKLHIGGAALGAGGLEPPESEDDGFTVHCNCRYATPPEKETSGNKKTCWRKDLNPQPSDYKSGALPIELLQQSRAIYNKSNVFRARGAT